MESLLAQLGAKDRLTVEKQMAALDAGDDTGRATLWKRLFATLMSLAPHRAKINAQSMQFYQADGKHRRQVFAMEDGGANTLNIYCEDILDGAIKAKLLQLDKTAGPDGTTYRIAGASATLFVERIDGSAINPTESFKHMIGWNRKALRITLPVTASEPQIATTEILCALSIGPESA
jgi:hypothetical protein